MCSSDLSRAVTITIKGGTRVSSVVTRQQFGGGSPGDLAPTTRARGDTSISSSGVIKCQVDPVSVTVLTVQMRGL